MLLQSNNNEVLPKRRNRRIARRLSIAASMLAFSTGLIAQAPTPRDSASRDSGARDPGPRGGASGAGQPIAGLSAGELDFFTHIGKPAFSEVDAVINGLGPRFNLDSCGGCHAFPSVGGSSPAVNPQVARASAMAPGNRVPQFLSLNGPVRVVRFVRNADGTPDGGVHDIFTISGRSDKPPGCNIAQPELTNSSNIIFRIPTPTFGAGLIESITDSTIRRNLESDPSGKKRQNGIKGRVNVNGNDGSVTRFGWKAQNKSLAVFAGEAYNVEQGVTNEIFPNEREEDPDCAKSRTPESDSTFNVGLTGASDVAAFRGFMRFLAAPAPACTDNSCSSSIQNGHALAVSIGCAGCHTETLMTGLSSTAALNQQSAHLFSDLALHHMGNGLADGISQGAAGPDEFRTAPLWGLGQRLFFLHDGRTNDLVEAIFAHQSSGSEANSVVNAFSQLSASQRQNILEFLRSL
jgi:CxxC motif-containing protein (DUF1111 family)